jgi:hypothetical protein
VILLTVVLLVGGARPPLFGLKLAFDDLFEEAAKQLFKAGEMIHQVKELDLERENA